MLERKLLPEHLRGTVQHEYLAGKSICELSRLLGVSPRIITRFIMSLDIEVRDGRAASKFLRHSLNQCAFDNAEADREAAYWVGFLMADGCVTKNSKSQALAVGLQGSDHGHLVKLKTFLKSSHPISLTSCAERFARDGRRFAPSTVATIRIPCGRLCAYLGRYGVLPRKTDHCQVRLLENSPDFWRGVIDGDGCMAMDQSGRAKAKHPRIQLVGHFELLGQFKQYVESFTGSTTNIKRWGGRCWHISVNGHWAIQVLHRLYHGATVSLDRKSVIVEQMLAEWPLDPTRRYANAGEVKAARKAVGATIYNS